MKRFFAVITACLLLVGITACGTPTPTPTPEPTPTPTPAPVYNDSLITESRSREGKYTDSLGNQWDYTFHVPSLTDDTPDARRINAELEEGFGKFADAEQKNMDEGISLTVFDISWKSYWHDSVLCLLTQAEYDWDYTTYAAHNYDFAAGKELTRQELLQLAGTTEDSFQKKLRSTVEAYFADMYGDAKEYLGEESYNQLLEQTLSMENEDVPELYLDGDGVLTAIVPVASPAGASSYYHVIPIND